MEMIDPPDCLGKKKVVMKGNYVKGTRKQRMTEVEDDNASATFLGSEKSLRPQLFTLRRVPQENKM